MVLASKCELITCFSELCYGMSMPSGVNWVLDCECGVNFMTSLAMCLSISNLCSICMLVFISLQNHDPVSQIFKIECRLKNLEPESIEVQQNSQVVVLVNSQKSTIHELFQFLINPLNSWVILASGIFNYSLEPKSPIRSLNQMDLRFKV